MIRLHNVERSHPLAKGKFFYVGRDIDLEVAEGEFVSISLLLESIAWLV